jgi:hypothetical protein
MAFPAECPVCKTVLSFPEYSGDDPVRCPSCNSRFIIDGKNIAHLSFTDYYAYLDVAPDADAADIRKIIRAKILEYHPDHNPDDPKASERLIEVIQAKELLTDPEKRRVYDSVYHAPALQRWSTRPGSASYRKPVFEKAPEYKSEAPHRESRYEEILSQARTRSRRAPDENIDHLVDEIEQMFAKQGLHVDLRRNMVSPVLPRERVWGARGAVFFGLTCLVIGLIKGSAFGALIYCAIGAIMGWILGSNSNSVVSLIFLIGRLFVISFLMGYLGVAFSQLAGGMKTYTNLITWLTLASIGGASAMGFWRIGVVTLSGRRFASLKFEVIRQGILGAWLGGFAGVIWIYSTSPSGGPMDNAALAWFILLSFYLLLDNFLFARPWIILY